MNEKQFQKDIETALRRGIRKEVTDPARAKTALRVCRMLVNAYTMGEAKGGSVDWADLDAAYSLALKVYPKRKKK